MDGPRPPHASEIDDLTALLLEVFKFFRDHSSHERLRRDLSRRARMRTTRVIVEDGKPVSHICTVYDRLSILGCRVKVGSVSSVCTHPEYRGRGFARTILAQSFAEMRAAGARIVIVSGNRGLYQRAHCVPAGWMLEGRVHRDSFAAGSSGLTVRRGDPDDWPILSALHGAEPVRFLRTADSFARLGAWWVGCPPELWLVESHDTPVAYLWLGPLWELHRNPSRDICEYAGFRAALVEAIPQILHAANLEELGMAVLGHDREFAYLLSSRGIELKPATLAGTHGLLNLPGLMRDMRPYLAARLPRADLRRLSFDQHGDTCAFGLGEERLALDASQATRLVLGVPEARSISGELGRVLSSIFPLPIPMAGFNSV
ncbi:MAG: GNAT family N-acetyltransferase [Armatimonadota bacterium]|nr:MAG: GNAT family N-acetyltransferase [Armatimonadota bacterium]